MREKPNMPARRQSQQIASDMDNFVSVFHASSLRGSTQQPQPQPPRGAASNSYCYIPGQYWQTLDYYDMAMDICTDYSDVSSFQTSGSRCKSIH
jgi:hypothetical protein